MSTLDLDSLFQKLYASMKLLHKQLSPQAVQQKTVQLWNNEKSKWGNDKDSFANFIEMKISQNRETSSQNKAKHLSKFFGNSAVKLTIANLFYKKHSQNINKLLLFFTADKKRKQ